MISSRAFLCLAACLLPLSADAADLPLRLTRSQALALALERNYDLSLVRTGLALASANIQAAGAAPNPVLGLSTSSINPSGANGSGSLWRKQIDTVISVGQLIERGAKRELRIEGAQNNLRAVEADIVEARRQLSLAVMQSYTDVMVAQDKLAAGRDAVALIDRMLSVAQIRRAAGDLAGADVERVKVDALRARNEVALAEGELARVRRVLALLLGEHEGAEALEAIDSWPVLELAGLLSDQDISAIIQARADVQAAQARVAVAQSGVALANALRTRDVTVGAQFEHFPQTGGASAVSGNSIGFNIQIPLFTRYYYQGEIAAAEAGLDGAKLALARTLAIAESEIGSAKSAVLSARERALRNRDELLVAAERSARAAEYAFQQGAAGVTDVLDARRTLRATRLDALSALADFSKALASWKSATETSQGNKQ